MVRFASLLAALSVVLVSSPSWACDQGSDAAKSAHRQGRSANVLERVDRVLDAAKCDGNVTRCNVTGEHRMFEKLSGSRATPQLPKEARLDASAGVFL